MVAADCCVVQPLTTPGTLAAALVDPLMGERALPADVLLMPAFPCEISRAGPRVPFLPPDFVADFAMCTVLLW